MKKTALLTGGSSGIGKTLVEKLSANSFKVYVLSRNSKHYDECKKSWNRNPEVVALTGDVTYDRDVENAFLEISKNESCLDLLVNNAGIYIKEDGAFPDISVLERNLEVNLIAHYRIILKFIPLLEKAQKPIILNVTSGAGGITELSSRGPLAYRVSKCAMNMLTKSLSFDLLKKNIVIHAADPGYVKTNLNPDGVDTPENAAEGLMNLIHLHDPALTGKFRKWGRVINW